MTRHISHSMLHFKRKCDYGALFMNSMIDAIFLFSGQTYQKIIMNTEYQMGLPHQPASMYRHRNENPPAIPDK